MGARALTAIADIASRDGHITKPEPGLPLLAQEDFACLLRVVAAHIDAGHDATLDLLYPRQEQCHD